MSSFEGKVAIVTGASSGLGEGIARELVTRGARVIMCSRSAERLNLAAERIGAGTPAAGEPLPPLAIPGDVTDPATPERLIAAARDRFGRLDLLVCNAGGPPPGDLDELDDRAWQAAFELIVMSVVRLIRAARPLLRTSGGGRIVIDSSISSQRPVPRLLLSNSLRPALSGLARHLACEFASEGILINVVAPGYFATERSRAVQAAIAEKQGKPLAEIQAQTAARIPLGRQGDPQELGRLVAFLLSDENSYLTGQTLVIDGGLLVTE